MKPITKTRPEILERENRRKARRRAANRRLIIELKTRLGCSLCGRRDLLPHDLAGHHVSGRTKVRKLSHMMSSSTAALLREVSQCRLVCVAAHQAFHASGVLKPCAQAFVRSLNQEVPR